MRNIIYSTLENNKLQYLFDYPDKVVESCKGIELNSFELFKVTEITYEDGAPRKEAIENFLSTMRINFFNLIFLIIGEKEKTSFYYGVVEDLTNKSALSAKEVGDKLLKTSIIGNFRGSKIHSVNNEEKQDIKKKIEHYEYVCVIDGVPGINEEKESFQGIDRFVDTMQGDEYALIITAKYLTDAEILSLEKDVSKFYEELYSFAKITLQEGENKSRTDVKTKTLGSNSSNSTSIGENSSKTQGSSESRTKGVSHGCTKSTSDTSNDFSRSKSDGKNSSQQSGTNSSSTSGTSKSETITTGTSESINTGYNDTIGTSSTRSYERLNKNAQDWIRYLDEILLKRIDYGKGKGMFVTSISVCATHPLYLKKAQNTLTALFSGGQGNKVPLRRSQIMHQELEAGNLSQKDEIERKIISYLKNFQIPSFIFNKKLDDFEKYYRSSLSQFVSTKDGLLGNWFSVKELSLITCLPQKEVVGLKLKEQVEFGLNYINDIPKEEEIVLGKLVQSGNILSTGISINRKDLDKHVFVTGVTGSGKTTTCQNILINSQLPFLVIEPAKTEYRALKKIAGFEGILIFTLGNDSVAPFRLNPLEFIKGESISSHVDMLKASIESAFHMEAAIPQIIERAIYKSYEDCGWDISNNTNYIYGEKAYDPGVNSFPTLSEMIKNCERVVEVQGFDERLKKDYIGSIKARLQGLVCGSKGQMLDCRRSIDFSKLLKNKVVLELEEIKSGAEKALIMGFILSNLQESLKQVFKQNSNFKHITLIEEAHRLLSRFEPGDAPAKKNGVEMFSDMLAEVRKYGESLIIADQIPSKLTPDVIKNTNTKIVHKIFAQDDKDVIGNTMSLSDEQKKFLSSLVSGRTVVFSQGWDTAIQVQIEQLTNTTSNEIIDDDSIRNTSIDFYNINFKFGVFPELSCLNHQPSRDDFKKYVNNSIFKKLEHFYVNLVPNIITWKKWNDDFLITVKECLDLLGKDGLSNYISTRFYYDSEDRQCRRLEDIRKLLDTIDSANTNFDIFDKVLSIGIRGR